MAKTDSPIKVRKVTGTHANWSEQGEMKPGKFSIQLILDNGAEETIVLPTAPDTKTLLKLLDSSDTVYYDTERGAVVFNDV